MDQLKRAGEISQFLLFQREMNEVLSKAKQSDGDLAVETIRGTIEDHYTDDQGKPAVHIAMEMPCTMTRLRSLLCGIDSARITPTSCDCIAA